MNPINRITTSLLSLILFLFFALNSHSESNLSSYNDKTIYKIKIFQESSLNKSDILKNSKIGNGEIFSEHEFLRLINNLKEREIFEDINYKIEESELGLKIELYLYLKPIIRKINIIGNTDIQTEEIDINIGVTTPFSSTTESKNIILERIKKLYIDRGYYDSKIEIEVVESDFKPYHELLIKINEGLRGKIQQIEVLNKEILPDEIQDYINDFISETINTVASERRRKDLFKSILIDLRKKGYLLSSIKQADFQQIDSENFRLTIEIIPREKFTLKFTNNSEFTDSSILKLLNIEDRSTPLTESLLKNLQDLIRDQYESIGYYFATVSLEIDSSDPSHFYYNYLINKGTLYKLNSIKFIGNDSISKKRIKDEISTLNSNSFLNDSSFLIRNNFNQDLDKIRKLYKDEGFYQSIISGQINVDESNNTIGVELLINEGERSLLKNHLISYTEDIISEETKFLIEKKINELCPINSPLKTTNVEKIISEIKLLLHNQGYAEAEIEVNFSLEDQSLSTFIIPNNITEYDQIKIIGNIYTKDETILREFRSRNMLPTENNKIVLWNPDKIENIERNLINLGIFKYISILPEENSDPSKPKKVIVKLEERDSGIIKTGFGYNTEDGFHLYNQIAERNFLGRGEELSLSNDFFLIGGNQTLNAGSMRLGYRVPSLQYPFTPDSSSLLGGDFLAEIFGQVSAQAINQYEFSRVGTAFNYKVPVLEKINYQIRLRFFDQSLNNVDQGSIISPEDEASRFFSIINTTYTFDYRDDSYNPTSGLLFEIKTNSSSEIIGSDYNFLGGTAQLSLYEKLSNRIVIAQNFRGGGLVPFSKTDTIPISERYFLGGRDSIRGFSLFSVGPRSLSGSVTGGDKFLQSNTELQLSTTETSRLVLFVDAAKVELDFPGSFIPSQENQRDIFISPGFGYRYITPIGPISLELGFPLNKRSDESFLKIFFGIGGAF